ncbi:MAG: hypothetical protein BWX79_01665 [Alphaproteobacteria bacterium ADurb.Bin100]|nr:MAG: hypothetical protein BWX79_01665 [Alphaproteobacteria bacterium ADurb.Bin100]
MANFLNVTVSRPAASMPFCARAFAKDRMVLDVGSVPLPAPRTVIFFLLVICSGPLKLYLPGGSVTVSPSLAAAKIAFRSVSFIWAAVTTVPCTTGAVGSVGT